MTRKSLGSSSEVHGVSLPSWRVGAREPEIMLRIWNLWNSHQRCACGWSGTTLAHRLNIASALGYVSVAVVVVALDAFDIVSLTALSWTIFVPAAATACVWYWVVPQVLWRGNACPKCGAAMAVDLVAGKPASSAASPPR